MNKMDYFDYGVVSFKHRFSIYRSINDYAETVLHRCIRMGIEFKIFSGQSFAEIQIVYKDVNEKLQCQCLKLHDWTVCIRHLGDMKCDI